MQIALRCDSFDLAEALRLGLVNRVVPEAELRAQTLALAQRLAAGPTLAYGQLKRLLRQSFDNDLATQLDASQSSARPSAPAH